MNLSPERFNRFLHKMGKRFVWRPSEACSCLNPFSGAADQYCPLCRGVGRIWSDGIEGVAGVTHVDTSRDWKEFGRLEAGDVTVTVPEVSPLFDLKEFDRLMLVDSDELFSITMVRGDADYFSFTAKQVDEVFWLDEDKQRVNGGIPLIHSNGTLEWTDGDGPPDGVRYSISGRRHTEYFVYIGLPAGRFMHQGARLPKKVLARRWDLFGREESFGPTSEDVPL